MRLSPQRHGGTRLLTAPRIGAAALAMILLTCLVSLPWSLDQYNAQVLADRHQPPGSKALLGTDALGRSVLARCALGGAVSLGIGAAAATIAMIIGTGWGALAGYLGGRVDAVMMRIVDVMYGLPYILLVVLLSVALQPLLAETLGSATGNVVTLLIAIGAVSWLTLARVVRGQVLSLRRQPFIEAAIASGTPAWRVLLIHLLPNLVAPIIVYTTLAVPQAILQESFLSFLGIGVQPPLPSWGNLAAVGLAEMNPIRSHWWLLAWPCVLLGVTLLALNYLGDDLRDRFDPHARRWAGG